MDGNSVTDISLNGDIGCTSTGDIALVSDTNNLAQRIRNRFRTNSDYYLFGTFGSTIKNLIDYTGGDLIDLLEQTVTADLLNEEDIASVDSVNVTQDGDTFYIDIAVTDVTGQSLSLTGIGLQ